MKKNNLWIFAVVAVILIIFVMPKNKQEQQKLAGETISITENDPVPLSGQYKITFTLNSQTGVNLWKIKAVKFNTTTQWAFVDKQFTGASGASHNEICSMQADGYYCSLIADVGSTVAKTVTLIYTVPAATEAAIVNGSWETYSGTPSTLQNSQTFTTPVIQFNQSIGSGSCVGYRIWTNGIWGVASTSGNDCGVCCTCSTAGVETANLTQNADCTATSCPADGCGLGGCGAHIYSDYPATVANTCSALKACTANTCSPTCSVDTDGDTWAGSFVTFFACYDCQNSDSNYNPSITNATECGLGQDRNCDGSLRMGNSEADADCNADTVWTELDAYITSWATSAQWSKPLPAHTITWTLLDTAITKWATE